MSWMWCAEGHTHWGPRGAAGLLVASEGAVLLQLRVGWAHHGGTWSIPGGARERGEGPVEAALRESHEELGLEADAVEVQGVSTADCGGWRYRTVLAVPTRDRAALRLRDRSESAGHRWVPVDEVASLGLHPAFRTAWERPDGVLRDFSAGRGSGAASR